MIEFITNDTLYSIFNSTKNEYVMHPIEDRKLYMVYLDGLDFIKDNKMSVAKYLLSVQAGLEVVDFKRVSL